VKYSKFAKKFDVRNALLSKLIKLYSLPNLTSATQFD